MNISKRSGATTIKNSTENVHQTQGNKPTDAQETSIFSSLHSLDIEISQKLSICATKDSSSSRALLIALEISGHGVPWILGSVLAIYFNRGIEQAIACNVLLSLFLDLAVVGSTKLIFKRSRPHYNEKDMFATVSVDNFSFPSGHSTRAAMVAGICSLFISEAILRWAIYTWAATVAISRVMLGRHHVSDVVCGVLIGWLQYLIMVRIWLTVTTCQWFLAMVPIVNLLT